MANRKDLQDEENSLTTIDRIIHEPARFRLTSVLYAVESADFLFLEKQTGLTRGNLSSHLSKLEDVGYVEISKEFVGKIPRTLAKLTNQGRSSLQDYKRVMQGLLDELAD
jgi:DNA-binding transcriptional ArsR family regulator